MPEKDEREKLAKVISQWNNNRLDLFEISQPDENLEFHGVIRFYFEDHVEGNVATKCLRVCSNAPTREVVEVLSEKFRPDMKMLTTSYSLFEIHTSKERKLDLDERPLLVQLSWNSGNREGRFVLKSDKDRLEENCGEKEKGGVIQTFKRTLSRKGKKKEKNKSDTADSVSEDENGSAEDLLNNDRVQELTGLPIRIQFSENTEDSFLSAVINYTNSSTVHFKLSPAYVLYAAARFALRRRNTRDLPSPGHVRGVTPITDKMVSMTGKVIQMQRGIAGALAFWMANSSELLNFLKHDKDLGPLTQQSQLDLSQQVHKAYSLLLRCLQTELSKHLPTFLIDPEQHGALPAGIEMVLNTLMNAMSLLRRCRVNPAFTIQLFSQLFHFISAWLFNRLMSPEARLPGLRSHYWGSALRQRLTAIEAWAERQGLELAADCHLGHILQATTLLTMNKYSVRDAKDIQSTCFKLNSLQLQMLLAGYLYAASEPLIPPDLIDAMVRAAESSADNLIRSEGRDIQLEESLDLHLPFLLPEGGYSCETVRGIPQGFREFLEPVIQKGLCSLTSHSSSQLDWTVNFSESAPSDGGTYLASHRHPEIQTITLHKPLNSGMGVSIVAAKGAGQSSLGIYIKSVVKGGPAEMNGRLAAGDQLLSVDGQSLVGLSQERAAAIMMQTGPVVTLRVVKFGASYHGLEALLREPTPEKTASDGDRAKCDGETSMLYCVVDLGPSERLHGSNRRRKEQMMQRNRQLYRSNPNMADLYLEDGAEGADPDVKGNGVASVSSINLCTDTFHREYLTLPNPKSKDKTFSESSQLQKTFKVSWSPLDAPSASQRTFMRQALSQDNLCVDGGRPLVDKRQNTCSQRDQDAKEAASHYSSFPVRTSASTHDILSDRSSPARKQQVGRTSAAGVWRTPFSQQSTPTPSVQPIRIDIPITRAVTAQSNPPLTTFQHSSSSPAVRMSHTLEVGGMKQSPRSQTSQIYACPKPAAKTLPQNQTSRAEKPRVSITPTKHVSFQEPPPQQKKIAGPVRPKDPQEPGDSWKTEAPERLEKQRRPQVVENLEEEVHELQAKAKRSAEENDRLRKLSVEWQFQKRLREMQQRGEDEEEDEDLDTMVVLQQLEDKTSQMEGSSGGSDDREQSKAEEQSGNRLSDREGEANTDQTAGGLKPNVGDMATKEKQVKKVKRVSAPEKLTFRERQRLFSLASSA